MQFFCRRKSNSTWSKVNKAKIQRLDEEGLMTQAGFNSIETAKLNGISRLKSASLLSLWYN